VLESVPPPLTVQDTPALFRSFIVAVSVVESLPSTVPADAVTATLLAGKLTPQPEGPKDTSIVMTTKYESAPIQRPERTGIFRNIGTSEL
jgi:hypothetical protein